ncbi:DUF924 family protein [Oceaniglobus indicus]|uniref:DUF924 family protein n=1 Tax=Oceaniglobus indicus TaxID=2047749 RepID=UPI000C1A0962|nr:DUF924 family protein [Oceaniglobus indicus]
MSTPDEILTYWLDEVGPKKWYDSSAKLDADIRDRFLDDWEASQKGGLDHWLTSPSGTLAYIILNDQFPRNMFRDTAKAFSSDAAAMAAAKMAIAREWDMKIDPPARQFFYMPLMHSECLTDQERSVRLFAKRMEAGGSNLLHARAHREVIRRFGRFPYRNAALGRSMNDKERVFTDEGGYGAVVSEIRSGGATSG